jgi:hypothetical protein
LKSTRVGRGANIPNLLTFQGHSETRRIAPGVAMIDLAECRRHAAECIKLARRVATSEQRELLFAMGRTWETLAGQVARYDRLKNETVAGPRPSGPGREPSR